MNSGVPREKAGDRRAFLRKSVALIGSAFALSVQVESKTGAKKVEFCDRPEQSSKGYQETAHVRTYYEKARF